MIEAILFDLDDTLLGNDIDTFLPPYFALISDYSQDLFETERIGEIILRSVDAVVQNRETAVSNLDTFWQLFEQQTGLDPVEMLTFFEQFYRTQFPSLKKYTTRRPVATQLIQECFEQGLQVVIATNPLFPALAIEERLAWAGIPIDKFPYTLVTTMENMHTAKPNPAYYAEILTRIGVTPRAALMVGNSWENDIEPASSLGLQTYWIPTVKEKTPQDSSILCGWGSLDDFYNVVKSKELIHA